MASRTIDPNANYPVKEFDLEYLRHGDTPYLATFYQPEGEGPFPMLLAVHGGAWNVGQRKENEVICRALAASGLLIASVDFRVAPAGPYPAQVQDVNYAVRWLKSRASEWHGDPETLGILGASSGGHTSLLNALKPNDPRYRALPLKVASDLDASVQYVIGCWPVIDPWSRLVFARTTPAAGEGFGGAEAKLQQTMNYFQNEAAIHEGNPQEIMERGEAEQLPPVLIVIGTEDMNLPLTLPQRFAPAYRSAGGTCRVEWFPGQPHGFARRDTPDARRAIAVMQEFAATCLAEPVLA